MSQVAIPSSTSIPDLSDRDRPGEGLQSKSSSAASPLPSTQLKPQLDGTSPLARSTYLSQGVLHVSSIFTLDEIAHIGETYTEQVERDPTSFQHDHDLASTDILSRYPRFVHPHRHPSTLAGQIARELMVDPRLLAVVENLVGPTYGAQSMFYFKPPTARGQALHQDNMSLQAHPETCVAAWIAVDDCDASNGGLIVIPGSHVNDMLCLEASNAIESFSNSTVKLPKDTPITRAQTVMEAGDVLFFHGSLVHGSLPNTTESFRRSLIFHYIPQSSVEVAKFYQPLIRPDGQEVAIDESVGGGACGDAWVEAT